jgi:hypothetical protein
MRALALFALAACASDPKTALFELPGDSPDFYATPFPNDLRREADGTIDLSAFPTNSLIADKYRQAADTLEGFGLNEAAFFRFDGTLGDPSLPTPAESVTDGAQVYLVDVDPDSPARGQRTPAAVRFRAERTQTIGENSLVVRPYPGFPLAEGTTYAAVITRRVGGITRAPQFDALMGDDPEPRITLARAVYQPLLDHLDEPGGDERDDVVTATVFTTQRATHVVPALRDAIAALPRPVATEIMSMMVMPSNTLVWTGKYTAPNFQTGDVPYREAPSGQIEIVDGKAVVVRMEEMRFALTLPDGPVPANGFPIAIYAHGTGGDYVTFTEDGTGQSLAAQGIATISTDQALHGPRNPGGDAQIDFFNFANPYAMQNNGLQGTADLFAQLRLVQGLQFSDGTRTIKFDSTKVYFFGHSQGGLTGPGFVAFEPSLSGAVFSGTGGLLYIGLLYKTEPIDISMLLQTFMRDDPCDEDNPTLAMLQMWVERSDGVNYAGMFARNPIPGNAPRNIFQTEGFEDSYTPNRAIEAFATAVGGDIVQLPDTAEITGVTLRGRGVVATPIANNINGATAVIGQYKQRPTSDGHFVVFNIEAAKRQAARFLGTLAATGTATVVP